MGDGALRAAGLHLIAELGHELAQVLELLGIGLVVDTIGQRLGLAALLHTAYGLSHRLIGQQHEFLDEFVGIAGGLEVGLDRLARLVDVKVELLAVELHGAVLEAGGTEFLGKSIELDEFSSVLALIGILLCGRGRRLTCAVLHTIILKDLLHLFVCIAAIATDDGMGEVPGLDIGLVVHLEDDAVTKFLLVGTEGADEVTESLREHGDSAVDEVDARGTIVGFLVDRGAFADVMGDVGDVHTHFI